jgi:hypothetical protein
MTIVDCQMPNVEGIGAHVEFTGLTILDKKVCSMMSTEDPFLTIDLGGGCEPLILSVV